MTVYYNLMSNALRAKFGSNTTSNQFHLSSSVYTEENDSDTTYNKYTSLTTNNNNLEERKLPT